SNVVVEAFQKLSQYVRFLQVLVWNVHSHYTLQKLKKSKLNVAVKYVVLNYTTYVNYVVKLLELKKFVNQYKSYKKEAIPKRNRFFFILIILFLKVRLFCKYETLDDFSNTYNNRFTCMRCRIFKIDRLMSLFYWNNSLNSFSFINMFNLYIICLCFFYISV